MINYDRKQLNALNSRMTEHFLLNGISSPFSVSKAPVQSANFFAGNIFSFTPYNSFQFPSFDLSGINVLFQSLSNNFVQWNYSSPSISYNLPSDSVFNATQTSVSSANSGNIFAGLSSLNYGVGNAFGDIYNPQVDFSILNSGTGSASSSLSSMPNPFEGISSSSRSDSSAGASRSSATSGTSGTASSRSTNTPVYKIGNFDLNYWKSKGYNHEKGQELALDAARVTNGKSGQCVGYTRQTINRVYGTNFQNAGKAYEFGKNILSSPQLKGKFKKVDMKDVERGGIPDGAIVLWKPGSPGFTKGKAALYGHGGICYQNKVYSNYVESRRLSTCAEVWIPV